MEDYVYDYFMVRVRRPSTAVDEPKEDAVIGIAGVAERLDTGEKHVFRNGAELLEVMLGGQASAKLPRPSGGRNDLTDTAIGR
jgi:hypothetical protein